MVNGILRLTGTLAVSGVLCTAMPGLAQAVDAGDPHGTTTPTANLVVFGGSRTSAEWHGEGGVEIASPLCITSSTGAYRLSIFPSSGLAQLADKSELTLSLEQDGAIVASQAFDGQAVVIVTGRTDPGRTDCSGGSNARLILRMPELALTSAAAGQYFDQFRLELEAI